MSAVPGVRRRWRQAWLAWPAGALTLKALGSFR